MKKKKIMHDLFALSGFDDFSGRMPVKKKKPMTKAIKKEQQFTIQIMMLRN